MELDLQSLLGLCAQTPSPSPALGLIYEGAIVQPRKTTFLCDPLSISLFSGSINLRKEAGSSTPENKTTREVKSKNN
jgi:hypothetical protein